VVSAKQENFIKSEYEMRLITVVVQVGAVKNTVKKIDLFELQNLLFSF
jgi:hypothetical protein